MEWNQSEENAVLMNDSEGKLPPEIQKQIASLIFEIGLKESSPKLLLSLMPFHSQLTTEHIKSHLQKYRIHQSRSLEEFLAYYESDIRDPLGKINNEQIDNENESRQLVGKKRKIHHSPSQIIQQSKEILSHWDNIVSECLVDFENSLKEINDMSSKIKSK